MKSTEFRFFIRALDSAEVGNLFSIDPLYDIYVQLLANGLASYPICIIEIGYYAGPFEKKLRNATMMVAFLSFVSNIIYLSFQSSIVTQSSCKTFSEDYIFFFDALRFDRDIVIFSQSPFTCSKGSGKMGFARYSSFFAILRKF